MKPAIRDVSEADLPDDTVARLLDGTLAACVVRGVFLPEQMGSVAERLETDQLGMPRQHRDFDDPDRVQVGVYGEPISPSQRFPTGPDPDVYFAQVDAIPSRLPALFGDAPGYLPTLERVFAGAGVEAKRAEGYGACTIRHVPPGCELDRHCENLYARIPVLIPLQDRLSMLDVCSFFLTIQAPEAGGELVLWEDRWAPGMPNLRSEGGESVRIRTEPGDLVLAAAGNQFHAVSPVQGDRARWTIGGFFAPVREGEGEGVRYYG